MPMSRRVVAMFWATLALMSLATTSCTSSHSGKLPFGAVDTVRSGSTLEGIVPVVGWAASEEGVQRVCLYVDRLLLTCTEDVHGLRPDVAKVYPGVASAGSSGWKIQLDTTTISPGRHDLVVQAVSASGATRDLVELAVTVAPPQ
jgi:hypothetical protein